MINKRRIMGCEKDTLLQQEYIDWEKQILLEIYTPGKGWNLYNYVTKNPWKCNWWRAKSSKVFSAQ